MQSLFANTNQSGADLPVCALGPVPRRAGVRRPGGLRHWGTRLMLAVALSSGVMTAQGVPPGPLQIRQPNARQQVLETQNNPERRKAQQAKQNQAKARAQQEQLIERFLNMSPADRRRALARLNVERRQRMLRLLNQLDQLQAAERRLLRGRYQLFLSMPQDRRQAIRQELQQLRQVQREARRRYLANPELRERFSQEELDLLYQVAGEEPE